MTAPSSPHENGICAYYRVEPLGNGLAVVLSIIGYARPGSEWAKRLARFAPLVITYIGEPDAEDLVLGSMVRLQDNDKEDPWTVT